jgi:Tfp pilus assembly protein PilO
VTQRDRIVLGVLATAAVLAGFWFLLLAPRREEASKLAGEVATAQTRVDAARSKLIAAEAAKKDYNAQLLTLARLGKAVPADDDVPSLVYQLERTARNAGIDFRSIDLAESGVTAQGGTPSPGGLKALPFKVKFEGQFLELRKFLDLVHPLAKPKGSKAMDVRGRLLVVDGVSLAPSASGFLNVKAEVLATAFVSPAKDAAATGTPPAAGGTTPSPAGDSATPSTTAQSGGSTPPAAIAGGLLK